MATLRIQRTSEFSNSLRDYQIQIDGQKIGTIANGETKDFEITAGQHSIIAKIGWGSSSTITFEIKEQHIKSLKVGSFKNGNWIMRISFGLIAVNLVLKHFLNIDYTKYLIFLLSVIITYYVTIGRKKYLTLSEI